MSQSITPKNSSVARGAMDYVAGTGFLPGHTVVYYVGGQYAGAYPTGPFGTQPYGGNNQQVAMPNSSLISTGAKTMTAQDNTTNAVATAAVTLT